MTKNLHLRYVCLLSVLAFAESAGATCYSTPRLAIESATPGDTTIPLQIEAGYRVLSFKLDAVLRQRWAMIVNCGHPEWPAVAMPAGEDHSPKAAQQGQLASSQSLIVVHIGDLVRLWRQESLSRIEVVGVSEGSGVIGATIPVRLLHSSSEEQPRRIVGVVRGASDVEMQP
jgi:hypothetical protein